LDLMRLRPIWRFIAAGRLLALALVPVCISFGSARAAANRNLLANGDFAHGSGNSVDGWRTDAWILIPGTTDYSWITPHNGKPGELDVFTHRDNDARWIQPVKLVPGWYYISVEARTDKVLPFMIGANLSVLDDGIRSADLKGTKDWQRLSLYLKVPEGGADIDVALRLGGFMNLSRGAAFFRNASIVKVAGPPAGALFIYDLGRIRSQETTGPIGRPWTLVAVFLLLIAVGTVGWRMFGEPRAAVARVDSMRD
jgi:hypothetical protein